MFRKIYFYSLALTTTYLTSSHAFADIKKKSFEEIIKSYSIVGDFSQKRTYRQVSDEIFWPYKYKIIQPTFKIEPQFTSLKTELPPTEGHGRAVDHINKGRKFYLEGNYEAAKDTWLSSRARFGTTNMFHRRNDYLLGYAFLKLALEDKLKNGYSWLNPNISMMLDNATTFLSWAYMIKKDIQDPLVDQNTPKGLYNLASIYFIKNRYSGAFGAATEGLNFLRRTGRKDYRTSLRRILAESFIRNRSYLAAVRELDTAIRQDPDMSQAAKIFARIGEIYFDLSNYELARDMFLLANELHSRLGLTDPQLNILLGETMFWLGDFELALYFLNSGIHASTYQKSTRQLHNTILKQGNLRLADAYLAAKKYEKAKLHYFKVEMNFPRTAVSEIARVRRACLELPFYKGNNVKHARELLQSVRSQSIDMPKAAIEQAWACEVSSYSKAEQNSKMLSRIREFYAKYPKSKFLASLIEPLKSIKQKKLNNFLEAEDSYSLVEYFEANRTRLFSRPSEAMKKKLFAAYVDIHLSDKAKEFYNAYRKESGNLATIRKILFILENNLDKESNFRIQLDDFQKSLINSPLSPSEQNLASGYLTRLSAVASSVDLNVWLLREYKAKSSDDPTIVCDLIFPTLSRLQTIINTKQSSILKKEVSQINASIFPQIIDSQPSCATSMLDLEYQAHLKNPKELYEIYKTRYTWENNQLLNSYILSLSEDLHKARQSNEATELLRTLLARTPPATIEHKLAKQKLERLSTVQENLWNQ